MRTGVETAEEEGFNVSRAGELKLTIGSTFSIPYTSQDFPLGTVANRGHLDTNWSELLGAALTVGRPNVAHVFAHGSASLFEALFRLSLVCMAVEQRPSVSGLYRTDAFRTLDLTEKGVVSYFMGMTICKLFAHRLLDTPWLIHLDVFRDQLNPSIMRGRSRPDLVGKNLLGEWKAFECKGRSSVPSDVVRRKAKEQAQRVIEVNSTQCKLHIGAISYFRREKLEFCWRDPVPNHSEDLAPISVQLTEEAWRHYYAPTLAWVTSSDISAIQEAKAAADIEVEIREDVLELLIAGDWNKAHSLALDSRQSLEREGFRPDGLKVTAGKSWQEPRRGLPQNEL